MRRITHTAGQTVIQCSVPKSSPRSRSVDAGLLRPSVSLQYGLLQHINTDAIHRLLFPCGTTVTLVRDPRSPGEDTGERVPGPASTHATRRHRFAAHDIATKGPLSTHAASTIIWKAPHWHCGFRLRSPRRPTQQAETVRDRILSDVRRASSRFSFSPPPSAPAGMRAILYWVRLTHLNTVRTDMGLAQGVRTLPAPRSTPAKRGLRARCGSPGVCRVVQ